MPTPYAYAVFQRINSYNICLCAQGSAIRLHEVPAFWYTSVRLARRQMLVLREGVAVPARVRARDGQGAAQRRHSHAVQLPIDGGFVAKKNCFCFQKKKKKKQEGLGRNFSTFLVGAGFTEGLMQLLHRARY